MQTFFPQFLDAMITTGSETVISGELEGGDIPKVSRLHIQDVVIKAPSRYSI